MKSVKFCKYTEFEVVEIPVSESDAYCCPQSVVDALDKPVGNSFDEGVEDLISPVSQCFYELLQILIACNLGF